MGEEPWVGGAFHESAVASMKTNEKAKNILHKPADSQDDWVTLHNLITSPLFPSFSQIDNQENKGIS